MFSTTSRQSKHVSSLSTHYKTLRKYKIKVWYDQKWFTIIFKKSSKTSYLELYSEILFEV